jgi:hypothetical protein
MAEIKHKDTALKQRDAEIEHKEEFANQIVRRMVQKGINLESIQEITGFNKEEIEMIIKNI